MDSFLQLDETTPEYSGALDQGEEYKLIEKARVEEVLPENPPKEKVHREPYIPSPDLKSAVDLAMRLGRDVWPAAAEEEKK